MIANIVTWLSIKVATRRLALVGGVLAIVGHAFRVMISLIIEARPGAAVDTPIIVTIMLSFAGLALLGTATLRAKQLTGRAAWAPLFVLAGGLVAAPFYSFDKVVHFILLGLLWGSAWLHMALVGHRRAVATVREPCSDDSIPTKRRAPRATPVCSTGGASALPACLSLSFSGGCLLAVAAAAR
jgi:hypothetical protein